MRKICLQLSSDFLTFFGMFTRTLARPPDQHSNLARSYEPFNLFNVLFEGHLTFVAESDLRFEAHTCSLFELLKDIPSSIRTYKCSLLYIHSLIPHESS